MRKVLYIFGLLTDADIGWLGMNGSCRRIRSGEVLIQEGKQTDSLILLLEGEVQVSARGHGDIARMSVGEIMGEVSLVDSAPPSATIAVVADGMALFIDKTLLLDKLDQDEGFAARFYRALAIFLADRLRATRQPTTDRLIDLAGISRDELDMGIMERVADAGERFNRLLHALGVQQGG
ncbi:cyclic nucleotide-binding domain-containing protein [Bradyrhizobium sp. DOA9]|uniref:cyclic nucleotide-binding domain-containing protein n=1 Tax=Bradyrhizobium sp. DOA9 TaxID=1126627 RepID=UPI00046ADECA|nr:cyclic nucleotide-binding domain-containing protein [Bradyrhizobium sp. DOA9]GAJ33686.1 cAMP-binding proteins - catabolite gene activator and regulatory subunit of cAMP-dependent protein kinases [Bradyrhizobium sp. DOA9]